MSGNRVLTAQIEAALRSLQSGGGSGDVVGPGSATNNHLAVFDGTTGKLLKDGGAIPGGGSTEPAGSDTQIQFNDDGAFGGDSGLTFNKTSKTFHFGGASTATPDSWQFNATSKRSQFLLRPAVVSALAGAAGELELGNNAGDGTAGNDTALFGIGLTESSNYHDDIILVGHALVDTDDHQTWFGDTVNPVFLVGTPGIHVQSPLVGVYDEGQAADVFTLGLAGEPTNNQIFKPIDSTGGTGASISFLAANATGAQAGQAGLSGGDDSAGSGSGADINAGGANGSGAGGAVSLYGGDGVGQGGNIFLNGGAGTSGDASGGSVVLTPGAASGSGVAGVVQVAGEYLNFAGDKGESGFGFRNNAGTIEAKNSGGEWAALGAGGGSAFPNIAAPVISGATPGTGGSFAAGDYYIKVAAVDYAGNVSPESNEVSATIPPENDGTGSITLSINWTAGANSYRIGVGTASEGQDHVQSFDSAWDTQTETRLVEYIGEADTWPPTSSTPGLVAGLTSAGAFFADYLAVGVAQLHHLVSPSDTLTLGVPGAPTNTQTIKPAASTSGAGAGLTLSAAGEGTLEAGGGAVSITAGYGFFGDFDTFAATGGQIDLSGGSASGAGYVRFVGGSGFAGNINGGDIILEAGSGFGTGTLGKIQLNGETIANQSITAPDFIVSGSRFRPDDTDGHSASLSARDIDGESYVDFITVTNGNVPTCVVKATDFKAADDSSGLTQDIVLGLVTLSVKNGLVTAVA